MCLLAVKMQHEISSLPAAWILTVLTTTLESNTCFMQLPQMLESKQKSLILPHYWTVCQIPLCRGDVVSFEDVEQCVFVIQLELQLLSGSVLFLSQEETQQRLALQRCHILHGKNTRLKSEKMHSLQKNMRSLSYSTSLAAQVYRTLFLMTNHSLFHCFLLPFDLFRQPLMEEFSVLADTW